MSSKTVKKDTKATTKKVAAIETEAVNIDIEEVEVKKPLTIKDLRRKLKNSNIDVEIMNIAGGEVFYRCPKTHVEVSLQSVGDTETVDLDLLMTMKNRHKGFFSKYVIGIVDVYDDEITIEDVVNYLGIGELYKDIENLDANYIEDLILDTDSLEFADIIGKLNIGLVQRIAERALVLFKTGQFDSRYKCDAIEKVLQIKGLFDIELD